MHGNDTALSCVMARISNIAQFLTHDHNNRCIQCIVTKAYHKNAWLIKDVYNMCGIYVAVHIAALVMQLSACDYVQHENVRGNFQAVENVESFQAVEGGGHGDGEEERIEFFSICHVPPSPPCVLPQATCALSAETPRQRVPSPVLYICSSRHHTPLSPSCTAQTLSPDGCPSHP